MSARRACRAASQPRSTQRFIPKRADEQKRLWNDIVALAKRYECYGYRRITALLRRHGWRVNHKRVERIWHQEGLKIPQRQPECERLWLNDGSCVRLRPIHRHHVWSYDFMEDRTHDGRPIKILTVIDEFSRENLDIVVERRLNSDDVLHCLTDLFVANDPPEHVRSEKNRKEGLPDLPMGIGIHTGGVVVGNIGSEKRAKYGIVGSAVNETDRIQSLAQGGTIMISGQTYELVADRVVVGPKCRAGLKGLKGVRNLYTVIDAKGRSTRPSGSKMDHVGVSSPSSKDWASVPS